jgi:tetratricopeptide (TPR) repeat protein
VNLHARRADALNYLGAYEASRAEHEAALRLHDELGDPDTIGIAGTHNNFANVLRRLNDLEGAQAEYAQALAICKQIYGEGADKVFLAVGASMNLGMVQIELGELDEARERLEKAFAYFAAMEGPLKLGYASAEDKLGDIDKLERKFDDALAHYRNSERAYRTALGEHNPFVALPIQNQGQAELERGRHDAALTLFERALALRLESLPRTQPEVATSLDGRGQALLGLNRYDEARHDAEEALDIWRKALPADHPLIVYALLHVGLARFAVEDMEGARVAWQEAQDRAPRAFSYDKARVKLITQAIDNPKLAMLNPVPLSSYDE